MMAEYADNNVIEYVCFIIESQATKEQVEALEQSNAW